LLAELSRSHINLTQALSFVEGVSFLELMN